MKQALRVVIHNIFCLACTGAIGFVWAYAFVGMIE